VTYRPAFRALIEEVVLPSGVNLITDAADATVVEDELDGTEISTF
jgi:hypothetical protein